MSIISWLISWVYSAINNQRGDQRHILIFQIRRLTQPHVFQDNCLMSSIPSILQLFLSYFDTPSFYDTVSSDVSSAKAAIQACVAVIQDLNIMEATAASHHLQSVLFLQGRALPLVFDTGASTCLTPDPSDFISWEQEGECAPIDGLSAHGHWKSEMAPAD